MLRERDIPRVIHATSKPSAGGHPVLDNGYMTNPSVAIWLAGSLLIQVVVQESAQPSDRGSQTPVSVCGISFKVPADWIAERSAPGIPEICLGEILHKRYETLVGDGPSHFWRIAVEVTPWTFESVMERYDVRREGGRWFVGEGAREAPAYEIKGAGWWGLRVDSLSIRSGSLAPYSEGRFRSVESEAGWVIISSTASARTAWFLVGDGADREVLPLLLNTVSFDQGK
jgi:hypothetical protein